jgi:hypothetical protein
VTSPDRLAVPTNGHRPALTDEALDSPSIDPAEEDLVAAPSVTPGQVIAGFGILAALILLFLGRRRGHG